MSKRHGAYRGIFVALIDDPEFQKLSPPARLTLLIVRQCQDAGPSAIFRYYTAKLAQQTGLTIEALTLALRELSEQEWIVEDGAILWVRNGLRYDPHVNVNNEKQREGVLKHLRSLPKREIVLTFCDYYTLPYPFDRLPDGLAKPIDRVPKQGLGSRDEGEGSREPEEGVGSRDCASPDNDEAHQDDRVATFKAYSAAFQRRYGVPATTNAKVRAQIKQFVQRVPKAEAPEIAAHYVGSNFASYVRLGHPVGLLLADAEKLRTEWLTGRRISASQAQQADETQARGTAAVRLLDKAERQRRGEAHHDEPGNREGGGGGARTHQHPAQRNGHGGHGGVPEPVAGAHSLGRARALSDRTPPPDVDR